MPIKDCLGTDSSIHPVGPRGRLLIPRHRPATLLGSPSSVPNHQVFRANTLYPDGTGAVITYGRRFCVDIAEIGLPDLALRTLTGSMPNTTG
jgi:hypothetical protein